MSLEPLDDVDAVREIFVGAQPDDFYPLLKLAEWGDENATLPYRPVFHRDADRHKEFVQERDAATYLNLVSYRPSAITRTARFTFKKSHARERPPGRLFKNPRRHERTVRALVENMTRRAVYRAYARSHPVERATRSIADWPRSRGPSGCTRSSLSRTRPTGSSTFPVGRDRDHSRSSLHGFGEQRGHVVVHRAVLTSSHC